MIRASIAAVFVTAVALFVAHSDLFGILKSGGSVPLDVALVVRMALIVGATMLALRYAAGRRTRS